MGVTGQRSGEERTPVRGRSKALRALAGAAAGVLGVAGAVSMSSPVGAAEEFVVGSGRADARIIRVGPSAGQLALAPTLGLSLADYLGTLGRGEARVADWAALDGSTEDLHEHMPPSRTESTEENSAAGKQQTFLGTPSGSPITLGAMEQKSSATRDPRGSSMVTIGAMGIPGVIEIGASTAESTTGIVEKKAREARGVTRVSSLKLGGGAVTLSGLTWEAYQRTGDGATVGGSFRVEGLTISGQNVTVPGDGTGLGAVLPQINAALAPTGLVLDAPTVAKEGEQARTTPLGIRVVNSQVGQTAVAPVIGGLQPVRDPVTSGVIENCADCSAAILVADVFAGVVSGGGRFDIELGGATGYTEGTRYESPFNFDFSGAFGGASNDFAGGFDSGAEGFGDVGSTPSSASFDAGSASAGSSFGSMPTGAGTAGATVVPAPGVGGGSEGATGTLATSSRGVAGKTGGPAVLIGLAGLLGALALGGADFRSIRAARRTIPTS